MGRSARAKMLAPPARERIGCTHVARFRRAAGGAATMHELPLRTPGAAGAGAPAVEGADEACPQRRAGERRRDPRHGATAGPVTARGSFRVPAVGARQVPRPRLLRRLEGEREVSTVALVAPGGYGKSRL